MMKPTLASYLDFLTPFISPDLVSDPYLNRIRTIAERLPVLSLGSFECWLDANEPRVDLNLSINPRINEHITMRDWHQKDIQSESEAYQKRREKIRAFCTKWSQKDFFLKPLIGELSEVYDIADPNKSSPIPWLYISFLKTSLDQDPAIKAEIISKTLSLLDDELSSDIKQKLISVLSSLPALVRISAIGLSRREQNTVLRIYLKINTFEEIIKVLQNQRWSGNIDELKEKMRPWVKTCPIFGLALDFDGVFQPKIGIECHFQPERLQEHLATFTQDLCEQGICSVAKRKAILDWNGSFEVDTPPDFWSWPDRILEVPEEIPQKIKIKRLISFIKLVYEPNKLLIAKVYPMFLRPVMRTH